MQGCFMTIFLTEKLTEKTTVMKFKEEKIGAEH